MKKILAVLVGGAVLSLFVGCSELDPELPTGQEQQLDRPATLGGPPPNSFPNPDQPPPTRVPGE